MSLPGLPAHLQPWGSYFLEAGRLHGVDAYLLAAVCDRESGGGRYLKPPGPAGVGDGGHGRGLMQIDDRYHKEFVASGAWMKPFENICKGAEILAANRKEFAEDADAEFLSVCRYNASAKRIAEALAKANADKISRRMAADSVTTGGDYGSDCIRRRASFLAKSILVRA